MCNFVTYLGAIGIYLVFFSDATPTNKENESSGDLEFLDTLRSSPLFRGVDSELESKFLSAMVIPSYIQRFIGLLELSQLDPSRALKGVSDDECKGHVMEWIWRISKDSKNFNQKLNKWVLQMLDSWGELPEGILSGHFNALGDFDECLKVSVSDLSGQNPFYKSISSKFEGRYCTVNLADYSTAMSNTLNPITNSENKTSEYFNEIQKSINVSLLIAPSIGTCFPNSCGQSDIQQLLVNAFDIMYTSSQKYDSKYPQDLPWPSTWACYDEKKPAFDGADYFVTVLLVVLASLCVGAGFSDYWMNHGVAEPPRRGVVLQYFMAFSLYTNFKTFLNTKKTEDSFSCLYGIRFFTTAWVVLGHTFLAASAYLPHWNRFETRRRLYENWIVLTVMNGTFAVDTFFVLSGLLVSFNLLKILDQTKGKINLPKFYIRRYLRLTPTYAILVGVMATLVPYLGSGPYWENITRWSRVCEDNWWTNLLYVNNFVNTTLMCKGETWYLANDMQFYIVSPFIIYPMWRWELTGLVLLGIYTTLSCISPALLVHILDTTPATLPLRNIGKWSTYVYMRPYARIQTFLVGVWLGWLFHKTKGKEIHLSQLLVFGLWGFATSMCLLVMYSIQPWHNPANEIPKAAGLAYAGLSRLGWGLGISWIIFACVKGYAGLINTFLSWSIFIPLGRLCYCVYLVSVPLQMIFHFRITQPMKLDIYTETNIFFSHMVMSYMIGFICMLVIEYPFMVLQNLIFEGGIRRNPDDSKDLLKPESPESIRKTNDQVCKPIYPTNVHVVNCLIPRVSRDKYYYYYYY